MSDFDLAIQVVLKHEGGLVHDPTDPGGLTNFGISMNFLSHLSPQLPVMQEFQINEHNIANGSAIRNLTRVEAIAIYKEEWWDKYHYGQILNQALATKIFDLAVNLGPIANKFLQQACNLVADHTCIVADGILGPSSFAIINKLDASQVLTQLKVIATRHYESLVYENPKLQKYLKGWLERVNES